jgi:hypothetical membrane protein
LNSNLRLAGAFVFLGCAQFVIGLLVAESLYPGYSVSRNTISDLGATCLSSCIIIQPSSVIFNSSVFLLGALLVVGAVYAYRGLGRMLVPSLLLITGLGAMGVGVFTESAGALHDLVSLIVFGGGGVTAVASTRMVRAPLSYFSLALGTLTLCSLALYIYGAYMGLGPGGMERMIAYPVLIWGMGLGASLASPTDGPSTPQPANHNPLGN